MIYRCNQCFRFLGADAMVYINKDASGGCRKCSVVAASIWRLLNAERHRLSSQLWRKNNPQANIEMKRRWREENKEHRRQYQAQFKADNPNYNLEWSRENTDKTHAYGAKYRAYKMNVLPVLTGAEEEEIKIIYKWASVLPGNWHVDHVVPLSKGGQHKPENLQIISAYQNLSKHDTDPRIFYGRFYEFLCE